MATDCYTKIGQGLYDGGKAVADGLGKLFSKSEASPKPKDVIDDKLKGWDKSPSNKGGGTKWSNPANPKGDNVRWQPGKKNSPNDKQKEPYVKVQKGGKFLDENGKPIDPKTNNGKPADAPEAHLPEEKGACVVKKCF